MYCNDLLIILCKKCKIIIIIKKSCDNQHSSVNGYKTVVMYLFVGVLFLKHDGKSLEESPQTGSHVQSHNPLLLQRSAARR